MCFCFFSGPHSVQYSTTNKRTPLSFRQLLMWACLFYSQRVYQFFKTAVEKSPNVDIEPVILQNIAGRIPDHLKNTANQQAVLSGLLAEIQEEYKNDIKNFTGSLQFCSLAVLDPRVGHTTDVLCPFIPVLCHFDWLFHGDSLPRLDVVHFGRAWSSSPACTWHCSLHYLFLQATPLFPHGVTSFLALTVSNSSLYTPALIRTHLFQLVFFAVDETRRIFLSPFISRASRRVSSFFLRV